MPAERIAIDRAATSRYGITVTEIPVAAKEDKPHEVGNFERLMGLAVALLIAALGYCVWLVAQAQNVADLSCPTEGPGQVAPRDLKTVFQKSIDGSYPLKISEEEINAYLAKTLSMKQGGACQGFVSLEKVLVRLEEGRAEVVMVRKFFGRPMTISMWVKVEQVENDRGEIDSQVHMEGGPMRWTPFINQGGRFGRLSVPQGFLHLVRASYEQLAACYREELHLGFEEMSRIRMEEGALILDPRFTQGSDTFGF